MGREWLEMVSQLLEEAGIRANEEYAAGTAPDIEEPEAAVGLSGLDCSQGQVTITVRIISPRGLGGWECQLAAVKAIAALEQEGLHCQMGKMAYMADCDCYSIAVSANLDVCCVDGEWVRGSCWTVEMDSVPVSWVTEFTAEQDQGRRMIGASCQTDPVGVTPGTGGWTIRLVQQIPPGFEEGEIPEEPFELTAGNGRTVQTYSQCCWNQIQRCCNQDGMKVQRVGFALSRGVENV